MTGSDSPTRPPNSVPDPKRKAGTEDEGMYFKHVVVVMMENHSFDNLLGELGRTRPECDALTFDQNSEPTSSNLDAHGTEVPSFAFPSTQQGPHVSQSWDAVHEQINGGRMDGFVRSAGGAKQPMGYYPRETLPFAYSLAESFTLGTRWFCSAPGPTFPNRRFLLAGTAYGLTSSSVDSLKAGPPSNGTIFDRMSEHGLEWRDYFTDIPQTALIPSILQRHWDNHRLLGEFLEDCESGHLPQVSFVDPDVGLLSELGQALDSISFVKPILDMLGVQLQTLGASEEDPQDMSWGEKWAYKVLNAVLHSPAWPETLLIYTYDEHGGYYDHVAPPAAVIPDSIPPNPGPAGVHGAYDTYGPRVPAIVVSPFSKPGGVTDCSHDHTSILATIEAKWNLPALTYRDANATTVLDFLADSTQPTIDLEKIALASP